MSTTTVLSKRAAIAPMRRAAHNPLAMPSESANLYTRLLRPLLFRLDPETAHRFTIAALSLIPRMRPAIDPPELAITILGLCFANPVGLAAGMDKDARALAAWNAFGFGFAELGTITPRPQPGNDPPRMWRLPADRALINRLGFPGLGMEAAASRLEAAGYGPLRADHRAIRVGLNFGPNKDTPPERVAEDYSALARRLAPFADFIVVNISSPNTPGLREWQAPARMRTIVDGIRTVLPPGRVNLPMFLKIAPDLDSDQIGAVSEAALELANGTGGAVGIVATNTTLKRAEVGVSASNEGGLSGAPLLARSREVVARVYRETGGRVPIIGVGGIASAEDAYGHIRAGASLVEFYTGMIYRGPGLARAIKHGLARLLARDGFRSISEAVGSAANG